MKKHLNQTKIRHTKIIQNIQKILQKNYKNIKKKKHLKTNTTKHTTPHPKNHYT